MDSNLIVNLAVIGAFVVCWLACLVYATVHLLATGHPVIGRRRTAPRGSDEGIIRFGSER